MSRDRHTEISFDTEVDGLLARIQELERQVTELEADVAVRASGEERDLIEALTELGGQLEKVEQENHDLANMCVEIQERNNALTSLYVASQRLHATFDLEGVKRIITEILVQVAGAEEFGLFVFDPYKGKLHLLAGEGIERRVPYEMLRRGKANVGDVAGSMESFFSAPKHKTEENASLPIAVLPLTFNDQTVGAIVIYKLLGHKTSFSSVDREVLELVAAHTASALVSARLYSTMDRKLRTLGGFVQLVKSR